MGNKSLRLGGKTTTFAIERFDAFLALSKEAPLYKEKRGGCDGQVVSVFGVSYAYPCIDPYKGLWKRGCC